VKIGKQIKKKGKKSNAQIGWLLIEGSDSCDGCVGLLKKGSIVHQCDYLGQEVHLSFSLPRNPIPLALSQLGLYPLLTSLSLLSPSQLPSFSIGPPLKTLKNCNPRDHRS